MVKKYNIDVSKCIGIVNQLMKCLNAQQSLKAELRLQVFGGYEDRELRKRAQIDVTYHGMHMWTFASRLYKTGVLLDYACSQVPHGPFEEREAKTLLVDFFGTLAAREKIIAGQPEQTTNDVKKFFDALNGAVSSQEELELRSAVEMDCIEDNGIEEVRWH